jgi:hypothetical protein
MSEMAAGLKEAVTGFKVAWGNGCSASVVVSNLKLQE